MHPDDPVLEAFLAQQSDDAQELEQKSTVMELAVVDGDPPQRYVATFHARGLVQSPGGPQEADVARFGIWLPDDYLMDDVDLAQMPIVTYLGPHPRPWHPNMLPFPPFIVCMHMVSGTPLVALLRGAYELWTYQLVSTSDNGLNPSAASWARSQPPERFPVDPRPLTGRRSGLKVRAKRIGARKENVTDRQTNANTRSEEAR